MIHKHITCRNGFDASLHIDNRQYTSKRSDEL